MFILRERMKSDQHHMKETQYQEIIQYDFYDSIVINKK